MKRKIIAFYSHRNAVEEYRTFRPLKNCSHKVTFQDFITKEKITIKDLAEKLYKKGDIWFLKYLPDNESANVLFSCSNYLKQNGKNVVVIIDVDDNVFEIPFGNVAMFFWNFGRKEMFASALKTADCILTSTHPLKMYLKRFNKKIIQIPNCLDLDQWKKRNRKNKVVKIGWVYSKTHIPDIKPVKEAIEEIKEEFGNKISIELLGGDRTVFDCDVKIIKPVPFSKYHSKLKSLNWDIAIAPLVDNVFNRSKSNIKWLECSMAGSAVVASKVYPYEHSITNGKTGFICGSKNQWKNALRKLIESEDLRNKIVKNSRKEIKEKYDIKKEVERYNKLFELI